MTQPQHITVSSTDGYPLAVTLFVPDGSEDTQQVILICSATGVAQTHYAKFAQFIASQGRPVVTFDYRGIGKSAPPSLRGFPAQLIDWGIRDVTAMIDFVQQRFPGRRLGFVGHSVGGQLLGLAENGHQVQDALAIGAQCGYWKHWDGLQRWKVWLLWHGVIPGVSALMGYFPAAWFGLGRSLPRRVAEQWAAWGRHPDYLWGHVGESVKQRYRDFPGRLRVVTAADDDIAPERACRTLMARYSGAEAEFHLLLPASIGLSHVGHFGYFRESARTFWASEIDWLFRRT